jgi:hypothetical protein
MARLPNLLQIVTPKRRANERGVADTPTFDRASPETPLSKVLDRDHLQDLLTVRQNQSADQLMQSLFKSDPDVSAAVNAYLTVADTEPRWMVRDQEGNIDREGQKMIEAFLLSIFTRFDYTKPAGFDLRPTMRAVFEEMRYMILLRGALGVELIVNKQFLPTALRLVDTQDLEWTERQPGVPTPEQVIDGERLSLDIPTFFVSFFRKNPNTLYSSSYFVSAINTIAARQQVVNDLYRIMRKTGYPRMTAQVMEDVLRANAPSEAQKDEVKMNEFLRQRFNEIQGLMTNMSADQTLIHPDSVQPKILNEKNPAAQLDITNVIEVLNESNQAALKVMSTIIGRGESGVNTASVEARIFSMNAEQINRPIIDIMSKALTLALRLSGSQSRVDFSFEPVEMRPDLELENHRSIRQGRLLEQLSLGLITDDEYHIQMFGRIRPDEVEEMSGTRFLSQKDSIEDEGSPDNSGSIERAAAPEGQNGSRSGATRSRQER